MSSLLAVKANENLLNAEKLEDFGQLLAQALGATVELLNAGELTVKDIFTQVHGRMRVRYIELRSNGVGHAKAVKETNKLAQVTKQMPRYGTGFY